MKLKLHTTQKAIRESGAKILRLSYCSAQTLLNYQNPFAYNAGVYGWNCDYYDIDGVIICTGYRPHGQNVDYNIVNEYEKKALSVAVTIHNYEDKKAIINGYLKEFIKKVLED